MRTVCCSQGCIPSSTCCLPLVACHLSFPRSPQFAHSIRRLSSHIQFAHSARTLWPTIQRARGFHPVQLLEGLMQTLALTLISAHARSYSQPRHIHNHSHIYTHFVTQLATQSLCLLSVACIVFLLQVRAHSPSLPLSCLADVTQPHSWRHFFG
ncbi:hypothetical protein GQ42DRAFT_23042 [Ramicandelaber brevisporus]|nr:hypothetical protein GQ42DRAFT_23042 [Ramicandelaber brevisporus]